MVTSRSLHTAYSLKSDFSNLLFLVAALLLSVVFFFLTKLCFKHVYNEDTPSKRFRVRLISENKHLQILAGSFMISGFLLLINVLSLYNFVSGYLKNPIKIIEGRVDNFIPMALGGHGEESFEVNKIYFHYSKYQLGLWGYSKTMVDGGIIKPDLYVRITYLENDMRNEILKLETE